ncbi:hemolysin family protein [Breoghania sp. L-A4]|uniref:hemolysin family protein n=1 Tax=Breoghania sp. L-A4 TaxID=2304600 RepID=UPI0020BD9706|nr:hemolysin family protein [Breoghania sp. L-A4]
MTGALQLRKNGTLRENLESVLAYDEGMDATFSPEERVLLSNILRLREVRIEDVMIPRADIDAVDASVPLGKLLEIFHESGHSRMPVYNETLDDPRGMVHIKDLLGFFSDALIDTGVQSAQDDGGEPAGDLADDGAAVFEPRRIDVTRPLSELKLIRPVLFVPPSMPAADLMAKMQASRVQMALVIDEYGGTDGLVSLEDLVETVVGDIEDEHDEDEEPMITIQSDGRWVADARVTVEDAEEELGADFDIGDMAEEVDTLGGLLFTLVGRVPVRGELISARSLPGFEFEILDADPRRIKRLRITRKRHDRVNPEARRRPKRAAAEPQDAA